jgi:glycosyltransferase involved in cell wall biosynthesis
MLNGKTIAVVVPSYNEAKQIGIVIETMPDFVDRIVIVNDNSSDNMADVVAKYIDANKGKLPAITLTYFPNKPVRNRFNEADMVMQEVAETELEEFTPSVVFNENDVDRIVLINHLKNGGVGAGIARGYKWCKDHDIDCTAVMAGDGQMAPDELEGLCLPVLEEGIDYVKGNRLRHPSAPIFIPKIRFYGNSILSILTKISSGYWRVSDTQTGYTTISLNALKAVKLQDIYKTYGMPNDMLVKLNIANCTLREITIKPVYRVGEESKMKVGKVIRKVSWLLTKLFFVRLWSKYLFRDFHPLFLFYHLSFILFAIGIPYGYKIAKAFFTGSILSYEPILAFTFLFFGAFQSLMFAMWMDMQDNERLYK